MYAKKHSKSRKSGMVIGIILIGVLLFVAIELLIVKYNGSPVPRPTIPTGEQQVGEGAPLRYVVMGDSTAVSQGGDYQRGYAAQTAQFLAQNRAVTWINTAIPGAKAADVVNEQLPRAKEFNPDVVLVAVGANDVTHLTSAGAYKEALVQIVDTLRAQNSDVKIVLTGVPDMGSIPRFPQPLRWYAGVRTQQLNKQVTELATQKISSLP